MSLELYRFMYGTFSYILKVVNLHIFIMLKSIYSSCETRKNCLQYNMTSRFDSIINLFLKR